MIFGFCYTSFRTMFQPAYQSVVLSMLEKHLLIKGNSFSEVSNQVASIVGPLICSVLIAKWSKGAAIILDAITFVISFILIAKININASNNAIGKTSIVNLYKSSIVRITQLPSSPELFNTIVYSAICIFLTGSLIRFVLPAHILLITNNEAYVGYAMSIMAVGSICGAFLFSKIHKNISKSALLLYWALYGLTFLIISLSINTKISAILIFILGLLGVIVDIILVYNIQTYSKNDEIGKNFGIFSTFANTAEAFSNLASGVIGLISISSAFVFMAALLSIIPGCKYITIKLKN